MHTQTLRTPAARVLALLTGLLTALALLAAPADAQDPSTNQSYIITPQEVQTVTVGGDTTADVTPARVEGPTRFETAAAVAALTYNQSDAAVLVTGLDYPDALAASFAAGRLDAPVLLTADDHVPASTLTALDELDVGIVVIVGGTGVVTTDVEDQLHAAGYTSERVGGTTRFETAAAVAMRYATPDVIGTLDGDRTAMIASGEGFADALSAGPVAAAAHLPLFLTPRTATDATVNASLEALEVERLVVVGGTAAVSSSVVEEYQAAGYEVERWAGQNRTATAANVADNAVQRFGTFSAEGILLARGDDYPDALAASIHGARIGAPILLTANPTVLSPATEGWLFDTCPDIEFVRALGGTGAVSVQALDEAVSAAGRCAGEDAFGEASFGLSSATYDDGPVDPVELALFPCDSVLLGEDGTVAFDDADGDGLADRVGETDSGEAWISQINGVEQTVGQNRDRGVVPDGYTFHIGSTAPDCAVPVLWRLSGDPQVPTHELPVNAQGAPTVRFGIGIAAFVAADG